MMLSMADTLFLVCIMLKTSRPASAHFIAINIAAASLISSVQIISGSSRNAARKPSSTEFVCVPTSRWRMSEFFLHMHKLNLVFNREQVCFAVGVLITSIIAAIVVDLPLPRGAVEDDQAFGTGSRIFLTISGASSSSKVLSEAGT